MTTPDPPDDTRYYHGGPKIRGNWILPPSLTRYAGSVHALSGGHPDTRPDMVFVTTNFQAALLFAVSHEEPYVYRVVPSPGIEHDPDHHPAEGTEPISFMCQRAHIVTRQPLPAPLVALTRRALLEGETR